MIRHSPCERYLKYLLVHPDGYSIEAVRDIVRGQGLDYLSDDHAQRLRDRLKKHLPFPFQPLNKRHKRSQAFLSKEQIFGFFHPDTPSVVAHRLLDRGRAKEVIESMSLAGESPAFISHRVKLLGLKSTPEAIKRYLHFYWDLNMVDSTELRALMRIRVEWVGVPTGGVDLPRDQWLQYHALAKASYKDPRRMLTEMPVTPVAGAIGQLRLGLMPSQMDIGRIAEAARGAAVLRAFESMVTGGPNDASRGRDYAMVSNMMSELIEKVGSPDTSLQRELQQMALELEDGPIPHIGELPEGSTFTTDLLPAQEREKDVVDHE